MLSRRLILVLAAVASVGAKGALASIPGWTEPHESYSLTHTDGLERQGGETFLIVRHARTYPASENNLWMIPTFEERLPLEICPSARGDRLTVRVLWQGEAQVGAEVTADLPAGKRVEGRSDGGGDFCVDASEAGIYTFRTKHAEKAAGERDGKKYTGVVRHMTLVVIVLRDRGQNSGGQALAGESRNLP